MEEIERLPINTGDQSDFDLLDNIHFSSKGGSKPYPSFPFLKIAPSAPSETSNSSAETYTMSHNIT